MRPATTTHRTIYRGNSFNPPRDIEKALESGWQGLCPSCRTAPLLKAGLAHHHACPACGEDFTPADIASLAAMLSAMPAFAAACFVGYIDELLLSPPLIFNFLLAASVAIIVIATLLPRMKTLALALQWANWVGDFDPNGDMTFSDDIWDMHASWREKRPRAGHPSPLTPAAIVGPRAPGAL